MSRSNPPGPHARPSASFWKSRAGIALIAFLVAAGLLMVYEHRVHIFTGNGILVVLLAFCVAMHLFMHGGHGSRGGKGDQGSDRRGEP